MGSLPSNPHVRHISWKPTVDDNWTLHVSGIVSPHNEVSAGGWVLRDHNSVFKASASVVLSYTTNMMVILLQTLLHALPIIMLSLGVDNLDILAHEYFMNGTMAIENGTYQLSDGTYQLHEDCFHWINSMRFVTLSAVNNLDNLAAIKLAQMGTEISETDQRLGTPPEEIADILTNDVIGRWVPISMFLP
ncbi:hypothetical protein ACFE04_015234 [Oxalis oulophora]